MLIDHTQTSLTKFWQTIDFFLLNFEKNLQICQLKNQNFEKNCAKYFKLQSTWVWLGVWQLKSRSGWSRRDKTAGSNARNVIAVGESAVGSCVSCVPSWTHRRAPLTGPTAQTLLTATGATTTNPRCGGFLTENWLTTNDNHIEQKKNKKKNPIWYQQMICFIVFF